jgi:hypothetical protein
MNHCGRRKKEVLWQGWRDKQLRYANATQPLLPSHANTMAGRLTVGAKHLVVPTVVVVSKSQERNA